MRTVSKDVVKRIKDQDGRHVIIAKGVSSSETPRAQVLPNVRGTRLTLKLISDGFMENSQTKSRYNRAWQSSRLLRYTLLLGEIVFLNSGGTTISDPPNLV